jgi:hypothetical protein
MIRPLTVALVGLAIVVLPNALFGQARRYPLITTDGLRLHNTTAAAVTFKGKRAVRIAVAPDVARRPEYLAGTIEPEAFARVEGLEFSNGIIEVEVAGSPAEGSYPGARGFVGIAFRLQADRDSAASPNLASRAPWPFAELGLGARHLVGYEGVTRGCNGDGQVGRDSGRPGPSCHDAANSG